MKTVMTSAVLALLAEASAPTVHAAEISYFLKIPGAEGEGAGFDRLEPGDLVGGKHVTYELSECKTTSYSVNGSGPEDAPIPTETLSLNFKKSIGVKEDRMTLLRTLAISAASLFFLAGADHRESPALVILTSTDAAKAREIELLSWSWGETKEPRQGPGSIKIEARGGKHSDLLARWRREQTVLPVAKLETAEGDDTEYYTITMSDVLVSSYQSSGSAGGDSAPMDAFSLNFAKIEYGYKPQKNDTRNKKQ